MEPKKYTQFGTFTVIALGSTLIFCIVIMIITGFNDLAPVGIMGFVVLTLLIFLLIFYKLTITIDNTYILIYRIPAFLIAEISHCYLPFTFGAY